MAGLIEVRDRLKQRRSTIIAESRAALEAAQRRGKAPDPEAQAAWDGAMAEVDSIDKRLAEIDATLEGERRAAEMLKDAPERRGAGNGQVRTAGEWLAAELRGLTGSGTTNGGAFTPVEYARFMLDRLAAESVAMRSGVRRLDTQFDKVVIPHLTADQTSAWTAEAATITAADLTADQVTAEPRKLAAITALSNEVVADSDPQILDVVGQQIVRSLALKFDLGVFEGSGTAPEIRGLKNVTGIQTVSMGTNGAALTSLDPFADAIGVLGEENAQATAIVMHPRSWKALLKLKEQPTGNNKPLLQESAGSGSQGVQRAIYGVPVHLTSQLSITETQGTATNASSAYVYEASQVVAVFRQETRVDLDGSRLFNSDQSELRAILRADLVVPNAKAVARIVGIIP